MNLAHYRKRKRKPRRLGVLVVGGEPVTVDLKHGPLADDENCLGCYVASESAIYLRTDLQPAKELEVFLHELIHCIVDKYAIALSDAKEEALASAFGRGLAQGLIPWMPSKGLRPWKLAPEL